MNKRGFTLTEVLIAMAIMSIILAIGGMSYSTFAARYRLETQVRELYTDFLSARARAMQRNLNHFVVVTSGNYQVIEDTNDDETRNDTAFITKPLAYPPTAGAAITINKRGLVSPSGKIRFDTSGVNAVIDCIVLSTTRIRAGKWNGTDCVSQ